MVSSVILVSPAVVQMTPNTCSKKHGLLMEIVYFDHGQQPKGIKKAVATTPHHHQRH
jgi:hypothetical protein